MRRVIKFRIAVSLLATPFLVVLYLNIEKWAEKYGYDLILTQISEGKVQGPILSFLLDPRLLVIAVGVVSFALGVWVVSILRKQDRERVESNLPTFLRAQFRKDSHNVTLVESENIRFWFANRQHALVKGIGNEQIERLNEEFACWQIFIVFAEATVFDQIFVDGHGAQIPNHSLKAHSPWGVVLEFQGDMGGALVDIRFGKPNRA